MSELIPSPQLDLQVRRSEDVSRGELVTHALWVTRWLQCSTLPLLQTAYVEAITTPMTWVRYTGNWQASYEGWVFSAESFNSSMRKTLLGLGNFYMAGHWVNPGGCMPTAAMSGRNTIQFIYHENKKPFITTTP